MTGDEFQFIEVARALGIVVWASACRRLWLVSLWSIVVVAICPPGRWIDWAWTEKRP